jgi:hypothetical protein
MKINCSNCGTQITLNLAAEAAEVTFAAYGKASKRVPAETISNPLGLDSSGLVVWEAPCCTDEGGVYEDTIEPWEYPAINEMIEGW